MGLCLRWASRSAKLASNNPTIPKLKVLCRFSSQSSNYPSVSKRTEAILAAMSLDQIPHLFVSLTMLSAKSQDRNIRGRNVWLENNWGGTEYYLTAHHELTLSLFLPLTQVQGPRVCVCVCCRLINLQRGLAIIAAISSQLPDSTFKLFFSAWNTCSYTKTTTFTRWKGI